MIHFTKTLQIALTIGILLFTSVVSLKAAPERSDTDQQVLKRLNRHWYAPEQEGLQSIRANLRVQRSSKGPNQTSSPLLTLLWKKGGESKVMVPGNKHRKRIRTERLERLIHLFVQEPFRPANVKKISKRKDRKEGTYVIRLNEKGRTVKFIFGGRFRPLKKIVPFRGSSMRYNLKTKKRNGAFYITEMQGTITPDYSSSFHFRLSIQHREVEIGEQNVLIGTSITWRISKIIANETAWKQTKTYKLSDMQINQEGN